MSCSPRERLRAFTVALQISSFEEKAPPTCNNLVHPNCVRVADLTELDKVLCCLLYYVWGSKDFHWVLVPPVRDTDGGADGWCTAEETFQYGIIKAPCYLFCYAGIEKRFYLRQPWGMLR